MASKDDQQPLHEGSLQRSQQPPKKKCCSSYCCYKCLVVLYSLLFLLMGISLLSLGIWVAKVKGIIDSINDALTAPVILSIIVGLFMVIFAFIGLIGALKERPILLKIFFGIAIVVVLFQVVIGILAFIFREEAINVANKQLRFAIERYEKDDDVTKAVDYIQLKFKCCGLDKPSSWKINSEYKCGTKEDEDDVEPKCGVPESCCIKYSEGCGDGIRSAENSTTMSSFIYNKGCTEKFRVWVETRLDIIGATALALALIHVLGIFFTYFFLTAVQDRVWLFQYRKRYYQDS